MPIDRKKYKIAILFLFYLLTAIFIVSLIKSPGLADKRLGVINMTDFKAYKPFQYRVLMPSLIRIIEFITPANIKNKIDDKAGDFIASKLKSSQPEIPEPKIDKLSRYGFRIIVYFILNISALFLYLEIGRASCRERV